MNTQTSTPQHILAARAAGLSPLMCGALDAAARRPCVPDDFDWPGDREAYSEGYRDQADAMLVQAARNLGLMCVAMVGGKELDEVLDTLAYEDDIEDRNFWARGC